MAQEAQARRKQEENIQSGLFNLELEEAQVHGYHLKQYPDYSQHKLHKKQSDCPELSDWTSNVISNQLKNSRTEEKDPRRLAFLTTTTRYPSSLLSPQNSKKDSRLELSPIVVKFNAMVLSQNLIKSREKYIKKLKEDPYLTHY